MYLHQGDDHINNVLPSGMNPNGYKGLAGNDCLRVHKHNYLLSNDILFVLAIYHYVTVITQSL